MRCLFTLSVFVALMASCATNPPVIINGPQLLPVDESNNPLVSAFMDEFRQAIQTKDADWVIAHLDENVWSSFGGDGGIDEFIEHYKLREPDSFLWDVIETVFDLGATLGRIRDELHFTAPYVFSRFPKDYDAFFYSAVIVPDALMYSLPNDASDVIGALNYSVVKTAFKEDRGEKHENGFQKVETIDGQLGWVRDEYIRSPLEHRIVIKETPGGWKITALVEGD
ncbi:MAG: SH3 domain-containing protein [Candidatus Hinthialibacter antarcticus]|nr:SH3 domain-containing protein [Candidatus Hinthialibacter antarcticus]